MRGLFSRHTIARRVLVAALLASVMAAMPLSPRPTQAAGQVVAQQTLSNTQDNSEAPQIFARGSSIASIWGERGSSELAYTATSVGAQFPSVSFLKTGTRVQYQWPDVTIDSSGTIHIVYAVGDVVFHRSRAPGADWSAVNKVADSPFPNPTRIAVAPNGTIWIVWRDGDGTGIFFRFSDNGGRGWSGGASGGVVASEQGNMVSPDVAVDRNNNPHVVWYVRSGGASRGEIRLADWNGSSFAVSNITSDGSGLYDADPSITVDGKNVQHVVWRKSVGNNWAITYAKRPTGGSWQEYTTLVTTNGDAKYSPAIASDDNGSVYVTYSDPTSSSTRRISMLARIAGKGWDGPQPLSTGRWDSRSDVAASTTGGSEANVVFQNEQGADDGEVRYLRLRYGDAPAGGIQALPKIENNAKVTGKNTVAVTFDSVQGNPTQIRWRWNEKPTDATNDSGGWKTFANSINIPIPDRYTGNCDALTLYTQVQNPAASEDDPKSATISYDKQVQAVVRASNPKMAGLPAVYTEVQDTLRQDGASDGAPNYTRVPFVFLGISDSGDCSGLKTFAVEGGTSANINNGRYESAVPLTGALGAGPRPFNTTVTDALGNTARTSTTIVYDPLDTDPSVAVNNTDGAPVLADGATVTADSNTRSIVRRLTFSGVNVTDNLYGQSEGLAAGRQFWGVWVANSQDPNVDPNKIDSNLQWFPVRVSNPDAAFTIEWNLFTGLNYGLDPNKAGDYYVFVRFLDGAGNYTVRSISTTVKLDQGYTFPSISLPMIGR